jgi:histidinol dehydrogenase
MSGTFAIEAALEDLSDDQLRQLVDRQRQAPGSVRSTVETIISDVRSKGDNSLREMAARYDGVEIEQLEIPRAEWRAALGEIDRDLAEALRAAASSIAAFHRSQLPEPLEIEPAPGVRLGRRPEPLARIGSYAPGGRAAYPSSVLMCVIPARVAGVAEVVVCSPPGEDGKPAMAVLAACELAGADRVFALGGAGAIAAMAYGTETVPRVDKVVGPGNAFVTEAKRQLSGVVASDCLAGPSELLVIADDGEDPLLVALEMLAQAEHDPEATVALVTTSPALAAAVQEEVERQVADHPRREIIGTALATQGALLTSDSLGRALQFARQFAPEHLLVLAPDAERLLPEIRSAGAVFLGSHSSVVFGDYSSGTNHVLPTGGQARAVSGLGVDDFLRWFSYQQLDRQGASTLAGTAFTIASAEGLPGHAAAAKIHLGNAVKAGIRWTPAATRPSYRRIDRYDPGRAPCEVDLSDNTNLFGVPPSARTVLQDSPAERVGRYGSVYADELKEALARHLALAPEQIATGCGSDDLIDSAIRVFCPPGGVVAFPHPTFSVLPDFAHMNSARPVAVPLGPDFALDAEALLQTRAPVTYVCNPNNPTGTLFEREQIERLAAGLNDRGVLLIDEAYVEFCEASLAQWAASSSRALVLRTFSKAYGLAGLRVGYAVGPADLIVEVEKSRGPFKVGGMAEAIAVAALEHDDDWVQNTVRQAKANRQRLAAALAEMGLHCWPSDANFLLVAAPGNNARQFKEALRGFGIGVRAFPDIRQAGDCVRITVGPWPLMERLLAAIKELKTDGRFSF